jgi:predicted RNase H-like HicB family nuclease
MTLEKYDFDGFTVNLYVDEQGEWLAYFLEMPNISAFSETPQQALEELKVAWELVKEDYRDKGIDIPISPRRKEYARSSE